MAYLVSEIISVFMHGLVHNLNSHMLHHWRVHHGDQLFYLMDYALNNRAVYYDAFFTVSMR